MTHNVISMFWSDLKTLLPNLYHLQIVKGIFHHPSLEPKIENVQLIPLNIQDQHQKLHTHILGTPN